MTEKELEMRYDALSDQQKAFFDYLVEELFFNLEDAILEAEQASDEIKKRDPRLAEIVYKNRLCTWPQLVQCVKEYKKLSELEKIFVWFYVTEYWQDMAEAIASAKDNIRNQYVDLVGYFDTEEDFGKELVYERYWFPEDEEPDDLENLDFQDIADTALKWRNYVELIDPNRPSKWVFFEYF